MSTVARGVWKWVPGARVARDYRWSWLPRDLVAGLVLTALLIPAGMGYAEASGLPAITGLYATIVPLVAYAIFGPSRILVLGPDSSLAPLIAATVVPLAAGDPDEAIVLAGMLSILAGAMCIVAGLARFGFITDVLSKPVRYGYMNGIALVVIVSQLPKLFGFSVDADDLIGGVREFVDGVRAGETNGTALAIGVGGIAVILGLRTWTRRIPGVLICVVGATVVVALFDLAARRDLSVVGALPRGLPSFSVPAVDGADLGRLAAGAVGIALVSFADTSVLSRTFALRHGDDVDPNQEMVALGAANVAAGVFQGFPVSSSSSRTPVAEQAGSRSQLTGVVGAGAITLMLLFAPGLVRNLPQSALAAVVITAAVGLFEISGVRRLWRMRRSEFALSIVCFLGVAVFGVIEGIFIAVGLALANFIQRAWRPYDAVLGRVDGLKGYHDVSRYPEAKQVPGLLLYRWDAPLFFANADVFEERLLRAIASAPAPVRRVVVTAEPMTDVDTSAADVLERVHAELADDGVQLAFAEMKSPVTDRLERYGLLTQLGTNSFFPTIGTAVRDYVDGEGVEWVDWEDAATARAQRDWIEWHRSYDDEDSSLARRLTVVRRRIGDVLDAVAPGREIGVLSLCSGEGRDLLPELAAHPDLAARVVLVERDPELAARAGRAAADLPTVDVRTGDAGDVATFRDVLPVDLLLLCGIFGNVSEADIRRTVAAVPGMLTPGGTVIWTRGRFADDIDLRPDVRRWFTDAGLEEVAFDGEPESFGVGVARRPRSTAVTGEAPPRLFTFAGRAG